MNQKHTPGPWAVVSRLGGNPSVVTDSDGRGIVGTGNARTIPHPEKLANAHLIAAAPLMQDTLREILAYIGRANPPGSHVAESKILFALKASEGTT